MAVLGSREGANKQEVNGQEAARRTGARNRLLRWRWSLKRG